ncbi:MAG: NAD(P)H-dependent oxidoreductase [Candidatus Kaiserbacteria bacterium]|nr:NAD(P)H-dependent oxidoreductase [Candidatus Kaiserbacteria bacterium]
MEKQTKKIVILVANPVKTSFSYACGDAYEESARASGAAVRRFNIDEMDFDPALHQGYDVIQELEPDLVAFQEAVTWADHLVFIYPNWWNTMPAKMKGVFDRSFLPGFAFKFVNNRFTPLLKGKSARVINVVGSTHPLVLRLLIGSYTNELSHGVLRICGVRPVRTQCFGPSRSSTEKMRKRWLQKVRAIAAREVR